MSFGFSANGTQSGVDKALAGSKGYGDTSHHDILRDAARAIVATIPESMRDRVFVSVDGSGHHQFVDGKAMQSYGNVQLSIKFEPLAGSSD